MLQTNKLACLLFRPAKSEIVTNSCGTGIYMGYLVRSGYDLAKALGVTPQSLYVASGHIEADDTIKSIDIEQLCK